VKVQVTKRPATGAWTVRWRDRDKRPRRSVERKSDAEAFAKAMERRLSMGGVDPGAGAMTLAEFVEEYWRFYAIRTCLSGRALPTRASGNATFDRGSARWHCAT